MDDKKKKE